jgi:hypothetical protein
LKPDQLKDGRVVFLASHTKGRKERQVKLPADLYQEVLSVCGREYVFERLRHYQGYDPKRCAGWFRYILDTFRKQYPHIPYFKLHHYRGTAMSRALEAGIPYEQAAIAFGCSPDTMRKHYLTLNETAIADGVMERWGMGWGYAKSVLPQKTPKSILLNDLRQIRGGSWDCRV